jgi:hypothetical protein
MLNVGAAAGSYGPADRYVAAVQPPTAIRAQHPASAVPAIDATAETLPLDDNSITATTADRQDPYLQPHWPSADMQHDFLSESPYGLPGTTEIIPNLRAITDAFRTAHRPIVHIVRLYQADGSNADLARAACPRHRGCQWRDMPTTSLGMGRKLRHPRPRHARVGQAGARFDPRRCGPARRPGRPTRAGLDVRIM